MGNYYTIQRNYGSWSDNISGSQFRVFLDLQVDYAEVKDNFNRFRVIPGVQITAAFTGTVAILDFNGHQDYIDLDQNNVQHAFTDSGWIVEFDGTKGQTKSYSAEIWYVSGSGTRRESKISTTFQIKTFYPGKPTFKVNGVSVPDRTVIDVAGTKDITIAATYTYPYPCPGRRYFFNGLTRSGPKEAQSNYSATKTTTSDTATATKTVDEWMEHFGTTREKYLPEVAAYRYGFHNVKGGFDEDSVLPLKAIPDFAWLVDGFPEENVLYIAAYSYAYYGYSGVSYRYFNSSDGGGVAIIGVRFADSGDRLTAYTGDRKGYPAIIRRYDDEGNPQVATLKGY